MSIDDVDMLGRAHDIYERAGRQANRPKGGKGRRT
jgi:hypothetical protein